MKIVNLILLLIFTFFAGCNFESGSEDDSGGGLFSGHKEVTNSLFISVPANQTYIQNQNLDFSISHPYDLTVSGNPRIQLDIDGNTVYANYLKGSGSKKIIFRYTIQAGDEDTNGIEVASSLDLNGGTLQFSNAGVITNSTTDFISPPSTDNILVDTTGPSIILVTPPAPKIYYKGDVLDFIVIFDDSTLVSGTPRIQLDVGGVTRYATYSGGNATTTHIYKYHVQESDLDLDGISMSSPLGLNNGSLKDLARNNATLTFVPLPMITTYVDGNSPYVTDFTLPADKTYILGDIISVDVNFNETVTVASGTPTLPLEIGNNTENATYLSGSGTNTLTFQYIVSNGDEDTDGLRVSTPLSLNGATIQDSESNDARLDLAAPLTPNVIVDGSVPEIIAMTVPADANYTDGQTLDFTIQFDEEVIVTNTPRLPITLDTGTIYAEYVSGTNSDTLTFQYTVLNSDQDDDGISFSTTSLDLNSTATIVSAKYNTVNALLDFTSYVPADTSNIKVNENPAVAVVITTQPTNTNNGFTISPALTVEIRDGSNNLITDATEAVTLAFGTDPSAGTATLSGTLTVNAVNGIATFSDLSIDTVNSAYTLTASSGSLTTDTSNSFDITQAPATQVVFNQEPTNNIAGVNFSPSLTVEFQDANGNIVPTETSNITIAFGTDPSTGAATLGGTLTIAAVAGTATFTDINIDKAFTGYTLTASSGVLASDTSASFDISPNAKSKLTFTTQPVDTDYTSIITPAVTVEIQDTYGNITTDTDSITLAINNNPGGSTLSGTTTQAAVNGTATFNDISLDQIGSNYTLDATSGALTLDTSSAFDIVATPTQLVITQEPSNTSNGFVISPNVVVEIRDAQNNLVTDATDIVTVTINNNPSTGTLGGTLTVAAVAGIATFNDLEIDNTGVGYTLDFNSGALTSATSASFNITQAPATQVAFIQNPSNAVAGIANSPDITVELQDANGNIVPIESSNITLAFGTDPSAGAATLGGTLTVAASSGLATFNDITIDKAFTGYTLTASAGALTTDTSSNFDITPATKAKLAFNVQPVNTEYNSSIAPSITVEIQDAFGNVTSDTDNITLAINNNPGGSTLSGTTTQAAVAGTATFNNISLDQVGSSYTLNATSGALTLDTSSTFDIIATPTQLAITTQPSNANNGFVISPNIVVEIRDAQNNIVTSATDNVTVSINNNPSTGTLGGTLTVAAVAGIATFNDLEIDNTGVGYTLDFNSGALTSATSTSFDITQAPATQVAFIQNPSNAVAGVANSPDITVELQDANGNIVPTESSNVTLSFGTDPSAGAATLGGTLTVAASSGVATFNDITIDKALSGYTFTASSGALTTDTSSTFDISPALKAKLAFNVQPVNTEYNSSINPAITVEIQDAFGNVTSDTDNITLAINNNPGGSNLSGTTTQAAVGGTATFNDISLDQVGSSYTLDATSGALTLDTSSTFDIIATPTQLVITQGPTNTEESFNIAPAITIEIRDAQNNLVTSATNNISVTFNNDPSTGSATLGGTTTVAAVAGVATFSNLNIDSSFDGYTFNFSSGSLTNVISNSFNIFSYANLSYDDSSTYDFGQISLGSSAEVSLIINYSGSTVANSVTSSNPSTEIQYKGGSFPGTGGTCSSTISSNCLIVISYTPTTSTTNTETLIISYNDGSSVQSINKTITGEGVNTTPTKISITGSTGIITGDCIPFTIQSQTQSGQTANVSSNENISLLVNNGTGSFFSDNSCTTTTTSTSITSGSSSKVIYFETSTSGQDLTLIFNASTLDNTSKLVTSSSAPTQIHVSVSDELVTSNCSLLEVSLLDPSGIKTGASTSQLINISHSSDAIFYSDSFCTGVITNINFDAYEGTKNIYTKNETVESVNLTFSDNSAILTQEIVNTDFVSSLTWWDTNWLKRKKITLNNIDQATTFTDMPILVKLNSTRINYDDFNGTGSDIRFTLNDHTTELDYSIEQWDSTGDSFIWVRIPTISASSEIEIYMYYENTSALDASNSSNVFSNYEGVWNMDKSGSDYIDSTGSGKDGAAIGTITDFSGPIGNATSFDGASEIDTSYGLEQILGRTSTMSLWIKTTQVGNNTNWQAPGITGVEESGGGNDIFFGFIRSDGSIAVNSGNSGVAASNFIINDDNWRYVTIQRDETTGDIRFFVNGVLNGSGTSDTGYKSTSFQSFGVIADTGGSPNYFEGEMDGIRISNSYLDTETIKADFKFQADTHITYGQEEDL